MEPNQHEPRSLCEVSLDALLISPAHLQPCLGWIPPSIHSMLLARAVSLVERLGCAVREAIILLVSHWPRHQLIFSDMLSNSKMKAGRFESHTFAMMRMLMEGLLSLKASSRLKVVDFCGSVQPEVFQLPLLSLPLVERRPDRIIHLMQEHSREVFAEEDDSNLENVLSWKLEELAEKMGHDYHFEAQGPIEVHVECQVDLTDWIAMNNELIGLALQDRTPFHMKVTQMTINNYHLMQTRHLRWLLSMLDTLVLQKLVIYGKRKSMDLVVWKIQDILKTMTSLTKFGLGTAGPKMRLLSETDPAPTDLLHNTVEVLQCWHGLSEVNFIGMMLGSQLGALLQALRTPLQKILLYSCHLFPEDIE